MTRKHQEISCGNGKISSPQNGHTMESWRAMKTIAVAILGMGLSLWDATVQCNVVSHLSNIYPEWFLSSRPANILPSLQCTALFNSKVTQEARTLILSIKVTLFPVANGYCWIIVLQHATNIPFDFRYVIYTYIDRCWKRIVTNCFLFIDARDMIGIPVVKSLSNYSRSLVEKLPK